MQRPDEEIPLAELILDLKHRGGVEGSLGESPASLLAYMEELERRIARLEHNAHLEPDA